MYDVFAYILPKFMPNVGKFTHAWMVWHALVATQLVILCSFSGKEGSFSDLDFTGG